MKYKLFSIIVVLLIVCTQTTCFADDIEQKLDSIAAKLGQLEDALEQCEQLGLDVGYERIDYAVIRDFISYGKQDIAMSVDQPDHTAHATRAQYVADSLDSMYDAVYAKLQSYIAGESAPYTVSRNLPADFGGAFNGNFVDKNNNPIISNGYGVFEKLKADINKMQEFGADIIQIELGPRRVIVPKGSMNGWGTSTHDGATTEKARATIENGGKPGGEYVVKISKDDSTGYLSFNQTVSVKPSTKYTLSFSAKTENAGNFSFSPNGWVATNRPSIATGTRDWTDYSVDYTTAEQEYEVELLFRAIGKSDAVYLDNITLCGPDGKNVTQNGDFEDNQMEQSEHFQANTARIKNDIVNFLDDAQQNGVMVNVLISPHYFPSWVLTTYPETTLPNSGLGYDMNNPIIREALDLYIKVMMQEIRNHPALHSICITNEPTCNTRNTTGLETEYSQFLQQQHNDISKLNAIYGTDYTDFSQVQMPQSDTMDAAYYDWVQFNNAYTKAWHKFIADTVRKYAPNVPVHAKIMIVFMKSDSLNFGIDPEDFADITDYNGNDAWGFLGTTANGIIAKMMWYDLLRSIKPSAPIINSEDHIFEDRNTNYSSLQATHASADVWQGAVHGRDASILWIWGRTTDVSANTYGNILYRPDATSAVGKRSLDLNRLTNEVIKLQNSPREMTILYSPTSRAYSLQTVKVLKLAYEAGLYAGVNPGFITERQLANGVKPKGMLVVPLSANVTDQAYQAIAKYKSNGGKVVAIGDNNLSRDQHNQFRDATFEFDATVAVTENSGSITAPTADTLQTTFISVLGKKDYVKDGDGQMVTGVEKISTNTNSGKLWNLCNYTKDAKQIVVPGEVTDLLTGNVYQDTVTLQAFTPMLLKIDGEQAVMNVQAQLVGDSINITINNVGNVDDFIDLYATIYDGNTPVSRARIYKFVKSGESADISCNSPIKTTAYTAVITGQLGEYKIDDIMLKR